VRWLRVFRRRPKQAEYVGRHRPGSWGETALPPPIEGNRVDAVLDNVEPAVTIAPRQAKVRLGFADGTSMELSDGSGESDAFRATASRLLGLDT
jgi:hypothetical protein